MNTLVVCSTCEKLNRVPLDKKGLAACGSCKAALPLDGAVQEITSTGLTKLARSSDRPVVVDFWAEWCGPCKAFAPNFRSASQELGGQLVFAKINTEKHPDAAQTFGIRGIPTLIVFKNGVEADRQSGAMPLPALLSYLSRWAAKAA